MCKNFTNDVCDSCGQRYPGDNDALIKIEHDKHLWSSHCILCDKRSSARGLSPKLITDLIAATKPYWVLFRKRT